MILKKISDRGDEKKDVSQRPSPDVPQKGPAIMRVASSGSVVFTSSQWTSIVSPSMSTTSDPGVSAMEFASDRRPRGSSTRS